MVHCSDLSFTRLFSNVSAHQDDRTKFEDLTRPVQLNCVVDFGAKRALLELDALDLPRQQPFPLEAIRVFAGREKMTSDTGPYLRYFAHLQLAREEFLAAGVLSHTQFDQVDWEIVHRTLSTVPRMFQVWACKQVWNITGTNYETSRWSAVSPFCPSCMQVPVPETCSHILHCSHAGRGEALQVTIKLLDQWMKQWGRDPDLRDCIYEYVMGRGGVTMEEICEENNYNQRYRVMARAQNEIGWRRFMEGMICKEIGWIQRMQVVGLQASHSALRHGDGTATGAGDSRASTATTRFTIIFLAHWLRCGKRSSSWKSNGNRSWGRQGY